MIPPSEAFQFLYTRNGCDADCRERIENQDILSERERELSVLTGSSAERERELSVLTGDLKEEIHFFFGGGRKRFTVFGGSGKLFL